MARLTGISKNMSAVLDTIGASEGTIYIPGSDDGYNVEAGSTPTRPILFSSYSDHPNVDEDIVRTSGPDLHSTAAGRYQILDRFWVYYKGLYHYPDFSPQNQDRYAINQFHECHALDAIEAGNFVSAVALIASRWASLPGANYPGQRENRIADLQAAYVKAGGTVSA